MDEDAAAKYRWKSGRLGFILTGLATIAPSVSRYHLAWLSADPASWNILEYSFTGGFSAPIFKLACSLFVFFYWYRAMCMPANAVPTRLLMYRELAFILLFPPATFFADAAGVFLPIGLAMAAFWVSGKNGKVARLTLIGTAAALILSSVVEIARQPAEVARITAAAELTTELDATAFAYVGIVRTDDAAAIKAASAQQDFVAAKLRATPGRWPYPGVEVAAIGRADLLRSMARQSAELSEVLHTAGGVDPTTFPTQQSIDARLVALETLRKHAAAYHHFLTNFDSDLRRDFTAGWNKTPTFSAFFRDYRSPADALAAELARIGRLLETNDIMFNLLSILNTHWGHWRPGPDGTVQFSDTVPVETFSAYKAAAAQLTASPKP